MAIYRGVYGVLNFLFICHLVKGCRKSIAHATEDGRCVQQARKGGGQYYNTLIKAIEACYHKGICYLQVYLTYKH